MSSADILLLMSDDMERFRMEQLLRHAGHEVFSVSSVAEASDILSKEPLDLFICEFDRGDDDRIALLTSAKWRLPYLARLLLIDETEARIASKALETGIVHFTLVPPVSSKVLQDTTRALLHWAREQRLGTPAPQTGRNPDVRRHLRETVADDEEWEATLEGQPSDAPPPEVEREDTADAPVTSAIRGRVEWYY